jgi:hypothetical protein
MSRGRSRAATAVRSRRIAAALAFANGRPAWTMSPGLRGRSEIRQLGRERTWDTARIAF